MSATHESRAALVVIELDGTEFCDINWRVMGAIARLREFGALNVDLLLAGWKCGSAVDIAAAIPGVRQVLVVDDERCEFQLAEVFVPWLAAFVDGYSYVLIGATTFGKNLLPGVAALVDSQPVTDVIAIEAHNVFARACYAGRVVERVANLQPIQLLSIRGTAFAAITQRGSSIPAPITRLTPPATQEHSRVVQQERVASERPELTSARVVVSGGRGMQSRENFQLLYRLADKLSAAVGASRAAVDAGFATNDMQVGQTGKAVAPELYIAVGLSGAVQHLAGMRDAKVVVAINNDPDAAIFQVADYGLVADLFEAVPELIGHL